MRVQLIYPYFRPRHDRSTFRFPPLGVGYLASWLKRAGHEVSILDGTFMDRRSALEAALRSPAEVTGICAMFPFHEDAILFARQLKGRRKLLVAGGPLASSDPLYLTGDFDVVVRGEGERTLEEVIAAYEGKRTLESVRGIAYHTSADSSDGVKMTPQRELETRLDGLPPPARELFPNQDYIAYWIRKSGSGSATTTVMTSRGCPFHCEFCSNAVFGNSYRERAVSSVLGEVESALRLGYRRIHFADDVFTLKKSRVIALCEEIKASGLRFAWECLCRVDLLDPEMASAMKKAGCDRVFFGIESGSETVLRLINKDFTPEMARRAVETARHAGLRTGAFFILCYPGDTDESVLETIRFSTSLPLDYLSFTLPYPIPGTALYERMKGSLKKSYRARGNILTEHFLTFDGDFSEAKMRFAILKGNAQFRLSKNLDSRGRFAQRGFQSITDRIFRVMR